MTEIVTEGSPKIIEARHNGGFIVRMGLSQENGDFKINFKANDYNGDTPTMDQITQLEKDETGCENVSVKAVDVFFGFKEVRHNCSGESAQ